MRPVTLSEAVTASACVPGLFAPMSLPSLFEGYDVRLVDGGVYDNQGALGLLQEDCSVLIVSDACGQLALDPQPGGGHLSPLLRSVSIFQERMRLASYDRLGAMKDHGRLSGLAYVHLLTVAAIAASYFAPSLLGRWSWTVGLVSPVSAMRSGIGKWVGAVMTWAIARLVVPDLTRRYLATGRLETLYGPVSSDRDGGTTTPGPRPEIVVTDKDSVAGV